LSGPRIAYCARTIREDGIYKIARRRLRLYGRVAFRRALDWRNDTAGRIVERLGNRVRIAGLMFSVDSALIARSQKGEMLWGLHEREELNLVARSLRVDLPVVELGGAIGVIACLTNRKLADPDRHVVVEANPWIVPVLERNRDVNRCRFRVINKALAYDAETVELRVNPRFTASRVTEDEGAGTAVSVATTSVRAIADAEGFDEFTLICDVEGAEAALVEREIDVLHRRVRLLIVEIHPQILGEDTVGRLVQKLQRAGFSRHECHGIIWAFSRD
jgi:FkbM family methyltransferase